MMSIVMSGVLAMAAVVLLGWILPLVLGIVQVRR